MQHRLVDEKVTSPGAGDCARGIPPVTPLPAHTQGGSPTWPGSPTSQVECGWV